MAVHSAMMQKVCWGDYPVLDRQAQPWQYPPTLRVRDSRHGKTS
jgi:hypothetical protein